MASTVWPYLAYWKCLVNKFSYKRRPKYLVTFWATWKVKLLWLRLGQLLPKIGALFIQSSGHADCIIQLWDLLLCKWKITNACSPRTKPNVFCYQRSIHKFDQKLLDATWKWVWTLLLNCLAIAHSVLKSCIEILINFSDPTVTAEAVLEVLIQK